MKDRRYTPVFVQFLTKSIKISRGIENADITPAYKKKTVMAQRTIGLSVPFCYIAIIVLSKRFEPILYKH